MCSELYGRSLVVGYTLVIIDRSSVKYSATFFIFIFVEENIAEMMGCIVEKKDCIEGRLGYKLDLLGCMLDWLDCMLG